MTVELICGDCLEELKKLSDETIDCCITSPPYWGLRDYGVVNQLGLEKTPEEYVAKMVEIFREVKRVLKPTATLWLNLGDSYWGGGFGTSPGGDADFQARYPKQASNKGSASHETRKMLGALKKHHAILKPKDLVGIPWRVAFALQQPYVRQEGWQTKCPYCKRWFYHNGKVETYYCYCGKSLDVYSPFNKTKKAEKILEQGWYLRQDIIWHKPNPMPESVTDRCTKSHEYIFLLAKSQKYFFDAEAIKEKAAFDGRNDTTMKGSKKYANGYVPNTSPQTVAVKGHERWPSKDDNGIHLRNKRSVWTVTTKPFKEAHFATFPEDLIRPCVLAGCPKEGTILDPFSGAGTTGVVAVKNQRNYIGIDLNPAYIEMSRKRIEQAQKQEIMTF